MTPKEDAAMRYDSQKTTFMMVTALILALAAMLAGPAGARPIDVDGTEPGSSQFVPVRPDDAGGIQGVGSVTSPTPTWLTALQLRSEALDRQYGLGKENATPTWLKALQLRSEALDRQYGLGKENATSAPQADDGFGSKDASIGGAIVIAALLIGGLALVYTRRHGGKLAT
jgi:hypothetical protein